MRAYIALVDIYLKLALREKMVLFFNYVLPLAFLFGFGQLMRAETGSATQVVTMVLVIGILGNGLYGAGMRAVIDRETNILRRYKVAPITPAPLLVASMVTGWVLYLPTFVMVLVLTHLRYHMQFPPRWPDLLIWVTLGTIALRSIGLIVASVVNSVAESNIIIQLLYLPMLFMSGATFPLTMFPTWAQVVAQFLPGSYLYTGLQGTLIRQEPITANLNSALALLACILIASFLSVKLFRWEKDEKLPGRAKLWLLVVFLPFLALGTWQARTRDNIARFREYNRTLRQNRSHLIRGGRMLVGDEVIQGSLLLRNGRIEQIFPNASPDPKTLNAEAVEASGRTILPGFIDLEADLRSSPLTSQRTAAAFLYAGVTTIRSSTPPQGESEHSPQLFLNPGMQPKVGVPDQAIWNRPLTLQIIPPSELARVRSSGAVYIPGESLHARLRAMVREGMTPKAAILEVTTRAAMALGANRHFGAIRPGAQADLVLIDGDPLADIDLTERIADVFLKGEHLDRSDLLEDK